MTFTYVDGVLVVRRGVVAQDAVRVPGLPPRRRFRPVRIVIHRSAPRGEPRASPDDGPRAHPRGDARARARAPGTSLARSRPLPRDPRGTIARVRRLAWSACATVSARVLGRGDGAEPLSGRCGRACAGGWRRRKRGADDRRGGRLEKDELKRPTCRVRGIDATSDGRRFQKTTLDRDEREATIGERPPVETETRRTRRAFPSTTRIEGARIDASHFAPRPAAPSAAMSSRRLLRAASAGDADAVDAALRDGADPGFQVGLRRDPRAASPSPPPRPSRVPRAPAPGSPASHPRRAPPGATTPDRVALPAPPPFVHRRTEKASPRSCWRASAATSTSSAPSSPTAPPGALAPPPPPAVRTSLAPAADATTRRPGLRPTNDPFVEEEGLPYSSRNLTRRPRRPLPPLQERAG